MVNLYCVTLLQEVQGHTGSKASRVIFCGSTGKLFSTGFSRTSDRQYGVWDSVSCVSLQCAVCLLDQR